MTIDLICALIKKTLPLSFLFRQDERNREEEERKRRWVPKSLGL